MYLDIRLLGKEHEHINDQAIYSRVTNLSHFSCNKHDSLQSAIKERAFADESHIAPDDHPWLVFLDKPMPIYKINQDCSDPFPG